MAEIYFVNYYESKNHKERYKKKKKKENLFVQSYWKMSIQNTNKSLGIDVALLTVRGRWGWVILAV